MPSQRSMGCSCRKETTGSLARRYGLSRTTVAKLDQAADGFGTIQFNILTSYPLIN
jgi:hypothetical protein